MSVPVIVRATINLPNLGFGQRAVALPDEPYVAMCIRKGYVVIEGPADEERDAASAGR